MNRLQKITIKALLLPYLALLLKAFSEALIQQEPAIALAAMAFGGLAPLVASLAIRHGKVTPGRAWAAATVLAMPLLLIAVVKIFGKTVEGTKYSGCDHGVPIEHQVEF